MAGILEGKAALVTGGASGIGRATALAAKRANNAGYDARAQAVGGDVTGAATRGDREQALRECSAKAEGMKQYTWGVQQGYMFRNCMAGHGQME